MTEYTKTAPHESADDGVAGAADGLRVLTNGVTKVNAIPATDDGVTLKTASENAIGEEFTVINATDVIGPEDTVTVYTSGGDTINGIAGPYLLVPVAPTAGATITFKCIGPKQWWITAIA